MRVLIVEDEKAAVRNLKAILEEVVPSVDILAVTDSIAESVHWLSHHPMPDVIFMDIHLADGSAFEIFEHIKITSPIIFTTAYDEYALKAFKVNSVDYLLKPISGTDLHHAVDKLNTLQKCDTGTNLDSFISHFREQIRYKTHFLVPTKGDKLYLVSVCDIHYFYVCNNEVRAFINDTQSYIIAQSLEDISDSLDPSQFIRVNRQFIISKNSVKDIDLWYNGRLSVNLVLSTPEKIIISRPKVHEFKRWLIGSY